jgi:outer membrane biosynthesis protein TonB
MIVCFALAGALAADVDSSQRIRIPASKALKGVTFRVAPEYSPVARQLRVAGNVEVDVYIAFTGAVEKVNVVSGQSLLASGVVSALKKWKFGSLFASEEKPGPAVTRLSFTFVP